LVPTILILSFMLSLTFVRFGYLIVSSAGGTRHKWPISMIAFCAARLS
jgi:hypothetical protein